MQLSSRAGAGARAAVSGGAAARRLGCVDPRWGGAVPTAAAAGLGGPRWPHCRSAAAVLCGALIGAAVVRRARCAAAAAARPRRRAAAAAAATRCRSLQNTALVFVKPHANREAVMELIPKFLKEREISILSSSSVTADEIEKGGIIDSHYSGIAHVGMARSILELKLSEAVAKRFSEGYGKPLEDAIAAKEVFSAQTGMEALGVTPSELLEQCLAAGYEKLGSGLYCAKLKGSASTPPEVFVLNGFYARMREKFVAPGVVVNCFLVQWDPAGLSWSAFRKSVIGATNPADAIGGSLRAVIRDEWQELGLAAEPNYQDNGVHASAGPLEAVRERSIWLGDDPAQTDFAEALAAEGLKGLPELLENPLVELDGAEGRVFDLLEDVDAEEAVKKILALRVLEVAS